MQMLSHGVVVVVVVVLVVVLVVVVVVVVLVLRLFPLRLVSFSESYFAIVKTDQHFLKNPMRHI